MLNLLWIATGGAMGAISRYKLSQALPSGNFPLSTLCINLIGCFGIGLFSVWFKNSHSFKLFLIVGFLGSFTTFSAFSFEALQLLQRSDTLKLLLYITGHVVAGLFLVSLGIKMATACKW